MGLAANITQSEPITDVIAAYEAFDRREPGWVKVKIEPTSAH
jgi:threonine dehydrogenase-like Zn-dependent dehydrogenase